MEIALEEADVASAGLPLAELDRCILMAAEMGLPAKAEDEEPENFIGRVTIAINQDIFNHAMRVRMPEWKGDSADG